jgi:formamidopyrimidine-DNA glycosylase
MTEGPETYFYYSFIKHFKGKILRKLKILTKRHNKPDFHNLIKALPLRIINIGVKGKNIWLTFENDMSIFITHGMTGAWRLKSQKEAITKYDIHRLEFEIGREILYFNDWNNIATIRIFYDIQSLNKQLEELGPCILCNPTYEEFYSRFNKKVNMNKEISVLMLDQSIISGIGNYLRADILWKSRISPYRKYKTLNEREKKLIWKNTIEEANRHYKFMRKYGRVFPPERINTFIIYRKHYDPNGKKVRRDELNERSIYWVPDVQK